MRRSIVAVGLSVALAASAHAAPDGRNPAAGKPESGKPAPSRPDSGRSGAEKSAKPAAKVPSTKPAGTVAKPARPPDVAYGAYQRGLYLTASREALARLDKDGTDTAAMTLLGELYNQGLGVKFDPAEAARWYRLAAGRGDAHAMATLGIMTIDGRGAPRDTAGGRDWLEKAAKLGEPGASYNLALLLLQGPPADVARAVTLLRVAASGEVADAQHALGVMYQEGKGGLKVDHEEAARLFLRAARNGSVAGEVEWAIAQYNGTGTPRNEANAARQFLHAAGRGNAVAQNRIARLYLLGRGVPKNLVEAAAWNIQAANQGLRDSWLDRELADISKTEQKRAEALAAARVGQL